MGRLYDELSRVGRVQPSVDGERQPSFARLSILTRLIQASASFRGYPPLESNDALNQARIWESFGLGRIPEEELAAAFTRALERLGEGESFGAPNIREAWSAIKRERAEARAREVQARGFSYQAEGVTFAAWWERDEAWIKANLPEATREKMLELFTARKASGIEPGPPPAKDCYVELPVEDPRYCTKCVQLAGLYYDPYYAKYRCCECEGGRAKVSALWGRTRVA